MKTRKILALIAAAVLAFSTATVAFATASPVVSTVTVETVETDGELILGSVSREDETKLSAVAVTYVAEKFGASAVMTPLGKCMNISVRGHAPGETLTINLSGVKVGDTVIGATRVFTGNKNAVVSAVPGARRITSSSSRAGDEFKYVTANVVSEGKIEFKPEVFGPTMFFKVTAADGAAYAATATAATLPQTGDNDRMMTLALIALGCAAIASAACVSLKRSR